MQKISTPKSDAPPPPNAPLGLTVEAAVAASGIGRTLIFRAIQRGQLKARKYGRRTIILPCDLTDFLESLPVKEVA
ncbi:MAG TPA: DNA-binding protein [Pseudolabrys sp.]